MRPKSPPRTFLTRRWSSRWPAPSARPRSSLTRPGACSGPSRPDGVGCKRSATGSTARSAFGYLQTAPFATAADVFKSRAGVCRDFAHLAVTFCRALNIPARYAFGYLPDIAVPLSPDPMDFCGWMEVFLGGAWWTFDPRNNQRRLGRVLIGRGRDALDVAMISTYGGPQLTSMTVWADEVTG